MEIHFSSLYDQFRKSKVPEPYIFITEQNVAKLWYVGFRHSNDSKDPQYIELNKQWEDFLVNTEGAPRLVLTEGGVRKIEKTSDTEMLIQQGGEMAYVTFLAQQAEIKVGSPEPTEKEWFDGLAVHFDKDVVAYYDFARIAYQWNRNPEKKDFRSYVSSFLEMNKISTGWKEYDFSFDHMLAIHEIIFHESFEPGNLSFLRKILDPLRNDSIINKISKYDDSGFRDEIILEKIIKHWDSGMNLFIIYGLQHAYVQRSFLEQHARKRSV